MANRIKGISVEISGDTTRLTKALKNVDSSIKNTQNQLRDVNKLLKLDPGNTELFKVPPYVKTKKSRIIMTK